MYTYWTDTAATKFTAQVKHQTASYEESNKLVNFCWYDSQNIAQHLTSAAVAPEELFRLERNILIVKESDQNTSVPAFWGIRQLALVLILALLLRSTAKSNKNKS